jgi:hypothetical protein
MVLFNGKEVECGVENDLATEHHLSSKMGAFINKIVREAIISGVSVQSISVDGVDAMEHICIWDAYNGRNRTNPNKLSYEKAEERAFSRVSKMDLHCPEIETKLRSNALDVVFTRYNEMKQLLDSLKKAL